MSIITTNDGRIILKKAKSLMVAPYVMSGTYHSFRDIYDLSAIIGDTITIEQEDGETVTKNNEFVNAPLIECVSGKKYKFSAQCVDFQNPILEALFSTMADSRGNVVFLEETKPIHAVIRIEFEDESLPVVILPKVQLNTKILIGQLKTKASQCTIEGVALSTYVACGDGSSATLFSSPYNTDARSYTPFVPMLLSKLNQTERKKFYYSLDYVRNRWQYCSIDFNTGTFSGTYSIDPDSGRMSIL